MVEVIPVPRCPKCHFMLNLLEKRGKYKCDKCGTIYTKKEIDLIQFRKWNASQKQSDMKELKIKPKLVSKEVTTQYKKQEEQKKLNSWND
ncbi:MAG: hypothetical protein ACP5OA_00600 [Candidatus Woesearchaeota archaeon]